MAADVRAGGAFVELFLKDQKFKRGLSAGRRGLMSFARSAAALAAPIAGAFAFTKSIQAASNLEETMNKFNVVFGESAKTVQTWGNQFAKEVGRSEEQIARFLANSQDLFIPLGFEPGAAQEMSKQVTSLALDLASFNNMADDDTIRDLHAALTGSGEVMKKYGVVLSEAAVKQELLNQGMDPKNASDQAKAQARMNIIVRGTTAAQGDAIRSAGGFANQLKALQGRVFDAAAAIGNIFLPAATSIIGVGIQVVDGIRAMAEGIMAHWDTIAEVTGQFMVWMQDTIIDVLSALTYAWDNWGTLTEMAVVSTQLSIVTWANNVVHLFGTVIPTWLAWLYDNWRDIFTDIANITATVAGNIWNNLANLWDAIVGLFNGDGFEFTWTPLTEGFRSAIKELPQIAEREMGPLEKTLQDQLNGLAEEANKEWEKHNRTFAADIKRFVSGGGALPDSGTGGSVAPTFDAGAAPGQGASAIRQEVFGSFSAAALAAQGGSGNKTTDAVKEQTKKQEKHHKELLEVISGTGAIIA